MCQSNERIFEWMNPTEAKLEENRLTLFAAPRSDYFVDPAGKLSNSNAPFYYTECAGDFIVSAKVEHDFLSVYDACAIMLYTDSTHWAKLCFEYTDLGTHAVVSVITKETSDDANGPNIAGNSVWLQIAKKGSILAMHYSLDGEKYDMVRILSFPYADPIKVGFVAQSPLGEGGSMKFFDVSIVPASVQNPRRGK